jgi:hypothetical protein
MTGIEGVVLMQVSMPRRLLSGKAEVGVSAGHIRGADR